MCSALNTHARSYFTYMYVWCFEPASIYYVYKLCVQAITRFVYVLHFGILMCVCVLYVCVCVPLSIMVPGGRPASISRQQALVHCPSIDGPTVLDSRPLPMVTGQDGYMYGCVCV